MHIYQRVWDRGAKRHGAALASVPEKPDLSPEAHDALAQTDTDVSRNTGSRVKAAPEFALRDSPEDTDANLKTGLGGGFRVRG
jgi:hypothetical protein